MKYRKTPYDHLLARYERLRSAVELPRRRTMFVMPKANMPAKTYHLQDVAERVKAADQLGWNVYLRWDEMRGLIIEYVERAVVP